MYNIFLDLKVGQETTLRCEGDGSPQPQFEWQQLVDSNDPSMTKILRRSNNTILHIRSEIDLYEVTSSLFSYRNVSYDNEGMWRCSARNTIKGHERVTHSQPIRVEVSGRPLPLVQNERLEVSAGLGQDVQLLVNFCSDPPPRRLVWQWGSLSLEGGDQRGRFTASKPEPGHKTDCFSAVLSILGVERPDERTYLLTTDNGSGVLRSAVKLSITDPVSMVTVLAISISLLVIIVFCCICTVAMKRRHSCCFTRKQHFPPADNIRSALN